MCSGLCPWSLALCGAAGQPGSVTMPPCPERQQRQGWREDAGTTQLSLPPLSSPCHVAILSLCKVLRVGRQQDQAHHLEPPCSQRAWCQVVMGPAPPLELGPQTEPHCFCQMALHLIQTGPLSVHRDLRWGDRRGPWQATAAASLWAEHSLTPAASVNIGSMNE